LYPRRRLPQVYHVKVIKNKNQNSIGNVLLPPSILNELADSQQYPLLFRITNPHTKMVTHCGVLEFTAKQGTVSMPEWIMNNLGVSEQTTVEISNVILSPATFIKLQPQSKDFLEIYDPKAVLEKTLRSYSAVTKGENILIRYNDKNYFLKVLEIQPLDIKNAVSIIEADVNVEFAAPVGYVEPTLPPPTTSSQKTPTETEDPSDLDPSQIVDSDDEDKPKKNEFKPFTGQGAKISGKPLLTNPTTISQKPTDEKKPFLNKGQIQYLTQSELDAIKEKQQKQQLQQQPPQQTLTHAFYPFPNNKQPTSATTTEKKPSPAGTAAPATSNTQKHTTDKKPPSTSTQTTAAATTSEKQKPPSYFTGTGHSLK